MALSTIGTNAITDATIATGDIADGAVTLGKVDATSTEANNVKNRVAKAWVNFDGGGSVSIRDDFNISSITDHDTGIYSVNYSSNFSNANYAIVGGVIGSSSSNHFSFVTSNSTSLSTSSSKFNICHHSGARDDQGYVHIIAFGDS